MAKRNPSNDFNLADSYEAIASLIANRTSVCDGMNQLTSFCAARFPHRAWSQLSEFDFEAEVAELQRWLVELIENEPPPTGMKAFWFGLFQPVINGKPTCGLYVCGYNSFFSDKAPGEWDQGGRWWPNGRYAKSRFLDLLYRVAYESGGPGNMAEYSLGLGYASLLVASLARRIEPGTLLGEVQERTLAVGFDSGDALFVGIARPDGLHSMDLDAYRKPVEADDPDTQLYEIVNSSKGRWWIQTVLAQDGAYLPGGFGETGRREDDSKSFMATIRDRNREGDWNFPVLGPPVVRTSLADLLERLDTSSVQRLAVNIEGDQRSWEILNVVAQISWEKLIEHPCSQEIAPWRATLTEAKIFRVGKYPGPIAVTRELKEQFHRNDAKGLSLEPLGKNRRWRYQGFVARPVK